MSDTGLFSEFPNVSSKQWKQKIQYDLKGADYNETLLWESPEGITVKPFYHSDDMGRVADLPESPTWLLAQNFYTKNVSLAIKNAQKALKSGAEALWFTIADVDTDIQKICTQEEFKAVPLHFSFPFLSEIYLNNSLEVLAKQNGPVYLHIDILGHLAQTGNWYHSEIEDHRILEQLMVKAQSFPNITVLGVDGGLYQNAGANMVQQLAYSLAHAHEYLHFCTEKNLKCIAPVFQMAIGTNYFFEIAKLRALRLLWKSLAQEYKIDTTCHILAQPTWRNKTLYDAHTNMIRTSVECMAGIMGGADTLLNIPFDGFYKKGNANSQRLAQNQLLLAKHESFLSQGSKMTEGAHYVETLTVQLAEKALQLFKQVESHGGLLKELEQNHIQKKIKESAIGEQQAFNSQELVLVGTNTYPNQEEFLQLEDLERYPFAKPKKGKTHIEPILPKRLAAVQEEKRLGHG